ncbi:MAG: hypothetical protein ABWY56_00875 [Propionibacteriaceae bacterium]
MSALPSLFQRLVDDAAVFPPGNAEVADAVPAHLGYRSAWFAPVIGPLVVPDQKLGQVGRALGQAQGTDSGEPLDVSVVNSSGAGGIVSLAGREVAGVRVVAVESALRDLDDLAGNAARVVSAAAELDADVRVFVEIPYAPGWERAVETVEAAGLLAKLRTGGEEPQDHPPAERLACQLSVLIEADLAFKATAGLHHAVAASASGGGRPRHGFLNLLVAIEALVEGASETDAAQLLLETDGPVLAKQVGGWGEADATRVRRRLLSFGCCGVTDPVNDLVALGLLAEPT